eukprot:TRINITY_DN5675_c0_g1_i2.p1 TRINITY_DN5675_c0_g1~~TRINITY_DN5675_c0_g1_i2.p1  ORF type:complete len:288 (-),score=98.84 TRINITY_DN5675_c0_g1_i2:191-1054(-)
MVGTSRIGMQALLRKGSTKVNLDRIRDNKQKKFQERSKALKKYARLKRAMDAGVHKEERQIPQYLKEYFEEQEKQEERHRRLEAERQRTEDKKNITGEGDAEMSGEDSHVQDKSEESEEEEEEEEEVPVCKFFLKGKCKNGAQCQFKHQREEEEDPEADSDGASDDHARSRVTQRSTPVCKFFGSRSGCKAGDGCKFSHPGAEIVSDKNKNKSDEQDNKKKTFLEKMHQDKQAKLLEKQKMVEQKEAERAEKLEERKKWKKRLSKRTNRGQPLMKHRLGKLLTKIQK